MQDKSVLDEISKLQADIYSGISKLNETMPARKMLLQAFMSELDKVIEDLNDKVEQSLSKMQRFVDTDVTKKEN